MRKVLITGGSEGIGYALAECFAKDGCELIINGRNEEKLKNAAESLQKKYGVPVHTAVKDLSVKGSAICLYEEVQGDTLDVLVNNAGCGYAGVSWEGDLEKEEDMVVLNDASLMTLSRLFLRDHVQKGNGLLVNVSSTGAFQPGPYIASYYASKSFVLSYTKAIAEEAKGSGVSVHCLCPGPVDTLFYEKSKGLHPSYAMPPDVCAAYAYSRFYGKKVVLIPGIVNRVARIFPEDMKMKFVSRMKKRYMKTDCEMSVEMRE